MENNFDRVLYLQELCNKWSDFKVAIATKNASGDIFWSKHRSVMECWSSEEGIIFLSKVNNRTSFPNEIILDYDNINEKRFYEICEKLKDYGFKYKAYFSGSRGYHIHIFVWGFVFETENIRKKIKQFIIEKYGAEGLKASENTMIALENVPHYKTGNIKTLLRQNG